MNDNHTSNATIKVLIADDHEVIRSGLRAILTAHGMEIAGEAAMADEVMQLVQNRPVDLVLLDVRLGGSDGLTVLGRLKIERPELPVLMVSAYDNPTYVAAAVMYRAAGYVLKTTPVEELVEAIRQASAGRDVWSRDELRRMTGALATPRLNADIEVPLTQRESEVLSQLAMGLTNKQIAQVLNISYETVKEHVQHILRKVGVTDRTQAAVWAVRNELV